MADVFISVATALTSTAKVSFLSFGTAATAIVRSMSFCNTHTSSTTTLEVTLLKSGTTTDFLLARYTQLDASQTVEIAANTLVVEAGDVLSLKASNAGIVNAVASIMRRT